MRKALKIITHITLIGNIFHNFGAVNKIQLSQNILSLTRPICNLKLSEVRVAIGFLLSVNILKVELRIFCLSECNKKGVGL